MIDNKYSNPYGTWSVTTEGDVEGKSTARLGTFTGFIDDIAFHLADKCCYTLSFKAEELVTNYIPKAESVNITFDYENSVVYGFTNNEREDFFAELLKNRNNVQVSVGNYYKSVKITTNKFDKKEIEKQKALDKLTDREKLLLGLIK